MWEESDQVRRSLGRFCRVLLLLLFLVLAPTGCIVGFIIGCDNDFDCADTEFCDFDGVCAGFFICADNLDCADNEFCGSDGVCEQ